MIFTNSDEKENINGSVFIILYDDKKKLLMQHRTANALNSPNHWGFFGGSIEKGETPLEAIKRETFEELGIKIKNPKLLLKEIIGENKKERNMYFYVKKIKNKFKIKLSEGQGMKWIFPSEIDNLLSKHYVKRIIKCCEGTLK